MLVNHLLEAAELLEEDGIRAEVWKLNQIAPLSAGMLDGFLLPEKPLLVLEDSFGAGCVGQRIAALLTEQGRPPRRLILKNLGKTFAPEGSVPQLEERLGLDAAGLAAAVREAKADER